MSELTLVRHGRSSHAETAWVDAHGLLRWRAAYDEAGIASDSAPPAALVSVASRGATIVASTLPRAVASAERLSTGAGRREPVLQSALLREIELPLPTIDGIRLPLAGWATLTGVRLLGETLRPGTRDAASARLAEVERARAAAAWLDQLVVARGPVLVVTHAAFRSYLARALLATGWRGPRFGAMGHWSAWPFSRPAMR
jgi:broad specificity phosphatase PhoE